MIFAGMICCAPLLCLALRASNTARRRCSAPVGDRRLPGAIFLSGRAAADSFLFEKFPKESKEEEIEPITTMLMVRERCRCWLTIMRLPEDDAAPTTTTWWLLSERLCNRRHRAMGSVSWQLAAAGASLFVSRLSRSLAAQNNRSAGYLLIAVALLLNWGLCAFDLLLLPFL